MGFKKKANTTVVMLVLKDIPKEVAVLIMAVVVTLK
jgi:hypothetical protein